MVTKMQGPRRRVIMAKIQEKLNEGSWVEDKKSLNKFGNRSLSSNHFLNIISTAGAHRIGFPGDPTNHPLIDFEH